MKLSEIMKEKKITTQQLADMTGIKKRTLEAYRSGRIEPSFTVGLCIAKALDVNPYKLLD
jgi:transcriptional regulator with XRE-family HTH domain|nr:MAG TPA: helix-turn-helix domain protein [Caudoviricetes sp.]